MNELFKNVENREFVDFIYSLHECYVETLVNQEKDIYAIYVWHQNHFLINVYDFITLEHKYNIDITDSIDDEKVNNWEAVCQIMSADKGRILNFGQAAITFNNFKTDFLSRAV